MKRIAASALIGTLCLSSALPLRARASSNENFATMTSDQIEQTMLKEADALEQTPARLRAQGKEVSADVEKKIKMAAEEIRTHAGWDEVKVKLRTASTDVGTTLVDTVGKTVAATGEILVIAPLNIIENLAVSAIFGKKASKIDSANALVLTDDASKNEAGFVNWSAVVLSADGAAAAGVIAPVLLPGSAGAILVTICEVDNSSYCQNEIRPIHLAMAPGEESIGQFLGMQIHYAGTDVAKGISTAAKAVSKDAQIVAKDTVPNDTRVVKNNVSEAVIGVSQGEATTGDGD